MDAEALQVGDEVMDPTELGVDSFPAGPSDFDADAEAEYQAKKHEPAQMRFDLGGKFPTGGTLKLKGGSIAGYYKKGQVIKMSVTAVVRQVGQKDLVDKATGVVIDAQQTHTAEVVDIQVLSE